MKKLVFIVTITLTWIFLSYFFPPINYGVTKKDVWEGKFSDGTKITKDTISGILKEHKRWIESNRQAGRKANIENANLQKIDLEDAFLPEAVFYNDDLSNANLKNTNLKQANLKKSNLYAANLENANLELSDMWRAKFERANLRKVNLKNAKIRQVSFRYADLTQANLLSANLRGADISFADLSNCIFEPENIEELTFQGVKGLSKIKFTNFKAVVDLRIMAKDSGLRNEERALSSALRKYHLQAIPLAEKVFEITFFDFPTDSGADPWRSLRLLALFIIAFTIPYIFTLRQRGKNGIWIVWISERVRKDLGEDEPIRLQRRGIAMLGFAFYFSVLSAFSIGWRELNVGNWIARLQPNEYVLRATGWVRTCSGIQSLISVYLVALWALTYFSRLFE